MRIGRHIVRAFYPVVDDLPHADLTAAANETLALSVGKVMATPFLNSFARDCEKRYGLDAPAAMETAMQTVALRMSAIAFDTTNPLLPRPGEDHATRIAKDFARLVMAEIHGVLPMVTHVVLGTTSAPAGERAKTAATAIRDAIGYLEDTGPLSKVIQAGAEDLLLRLAPAVDADAIEDLGSTETMPVFSPVG